MKKTELKKKADGHRKAKGIDRKALWEWTDPTCTPMNVVNGL